MPKVVTTYGNFAKGRIDHDMMGRFDLPIYNTGADVFENFLSNYKGNAIFSAGFVSQFAFQDCAFIEFKFGITQNYLCVFFASKIRFLAFDTNGVFGWVINSGIYELTSPYTLDDAKFIATRQSYSQNADVMVFAHRGYAPYKLTRTASNTFTMATYSRTSDPFTGAGDWPGCVLFYKGRLFFASTSNKITTVWMSVAGSYDDFTIASPLTDASAFNFAIADIAQQIDWLFPGDNSLIAGASDGIVAINGGAVNTAITAATVQANITTAQPTAPVYPIKKDGLIFYVGVTKRNLFYFKYDILTESFLSKDANLVSYDITFGGMNKLRFKKDKNDLIYSLRGDGSYCTTNFQESENINGWHERNTFGTFQDIAVMGDNLGVPQFFTLTERNGTFYIEQQAAYVEFERRDDFFTASDDPDEEDKYKAMDDEAYARAIAEQLRGCNYLDASLTLMDYHTSTLNFTPTSFNADGTPAAGTIHDSTATPFSSGDVKKHIVYKTSTGYESGRFEITVYTDSSHVTVNVLQQPKQIFGDDLFVWSSWYRSFTTVSGLDMFNSTTVEVVADGGFLNSFDVSGGAITLDRPVTSLVLGYGYTGTIKTFCLGFLFQGQNTQTTLKEIARVGVRCVHTAGLKIGTSRYHTQPVQQIDQNCYNYLPPLPIDGTEYVDYTDDSEEDKFFYIVQDQPLPATIACTMIEANYTASS